MRPIIYDFGIDIPLLGPLNFPSYFTMLAVSLALASWLVWRESTRVGLDRERMLDLCLWLVVFGVGGARVLHVIADGHFKDYVHLCTDPSLVAATEAKVRICRTSSQCGFDYVCDAVRHTCHPPRDCFAAVKVWRGGLAFYGGLLFAAAFGLYYARKHRLGMWRVADLVSPTIALGLALTRIGCFLNGCCFGKPSKLPWAVHFEFDRAVTEAQERAGYILHGQPNLPVHPTQLYLAALDLLTFFLLYFVIRPRKRFGGEVFAWLLILKGVFRSFVEIWRDDERGVLFGWLSTSQMISVPLVALGIFLLWRKGRVSGALAEGPHEPPAPLPPAPSPPAPATP